MRTTRWIAFALMGLSCSAVAAPQEQQIGSWLLNCPTGDTCQLRFAKRFLDKGGMTGDLEVQSIGKSLVPVIALRGLSSEMMMAASLAGKADASIQFGGGAAEDLPCAVSDKGYICAPSSGGAQKMNDQMAAARSVTIRIAVTMAGMSPLPQQEKTLDLSGTTEALAKLRSSGPTAVPSPAAALASQASSPAGMMGMADKALKAAGYPGGVADVQALLAKYMAKLPAK